MPKAILEYDLDLPEDHDEFELASNARKYYSVIWEIDQLLRNNIKYASDEVSEDTFEAFVLIRKELWDLLEVRNLDLDK